MSSEFGKRKHFLKTRNWNLQPATLGNSELLTIPDGRSTKMNPVEMVELEQLRTDLPEFRVGDTVKVHVKIVEGDKERIQSFEGVVIRKKGGGIRSSFTVRKISYGIGVERIFPTHSPRLDRIDVISHGKVRRAKLFYLRSLKGKAARIRGEKKQVN